MRYNQFNKKKWDNEIFCYYQKYFFHLTPAFILFYDHHSISDSHVTPRFGITIKWLNYVIGFEIQKLY